MKRALAMLGALLLVGCGTQGGVGTPEKDNGGGNATEAASSAPVIEARLEIADRTRFDQTVSTHRGRVVLVDFWASWCGPCVQQFPHTVALSREYADAGLAVVSVCLDEPEKRESVLAFLGRQGADFDNLLSEYGGGSAAAEAFEIDGGALPHYKLFDRQGNLRKTFSLDPTAAVQFTHEDIEAALVELLEE